MSCAGCSDCDPSAFHLHITVDGDYKCPGDTAYYDWACKQIGMKPLIIFNLYYQTDKFDCEFIPTLTYKGTFTQAKKALHNSANVLRTLGFRVLREKIEAPPNKLGQYHEVHIEVPNRPEIIEFLRNYPYTNYVPVLSVNARKSPIDRPLLVTYRTENLEELMSIGAELKTHLIDRFGLDIQPLKIESALYDTNTQQDYLWINQLG